MNSAQRRALARLLEQANDARILITEVEYTMGNIHSFLFVKFLDEGGNQFHRKYDTEGKFIELEI